MRIARSSATQHISREYTKFRRLALVSHTPSSGWSQCSHSQSTTAPTSSQRSLLIGCPHLS